jgi:hypothetical protein
VEDRQNLPVLVDREIIRSEIGNLKAAIISDSGNDIDQ